MKTHFLAGAAAIALVLHSPASAEEPLTLERAVQLALERNERAQAAGQQAEAARARVSRARSFFFPDLTATGTYTRRMRETVRNIGGEDVTIQSANAFSAVANLRTTLFDARGFPIYAQASRLASAAELDARELRRLLGFETADAYLSTLGLERVLKAAQRRLEFARKSFEDAQARQQAQLVSSNDVTRAQLELSTAERELEVARGDAETAYLNLGYLIDTPVTPPLAEPQAQLEQADGPLPAPETLLQGVLDRRLDVRASDERHHAARAFASEPMLRFIPSLGLSAQYRMTNEGGLTGNTDDGFLSLDLTWSIFDGFERYAESKERWALARSAELDLKARQRRVGVEVSSASVQVKADQAALRQAKLAAEVAQRNAEETSVLYREGLTGSLEVADANIRRFDAEVALARAWYGLVQSYLNLRAAQGLDPLGSEP